MRDILRDDLKYKEIPFKFRLHKKYPYHHRTRACVDINIYSGNFCPNFFVEKVWLRNTLPTCVQAFKVFL